MGFEGWGSNTNGEGWASERWGQKVVARALRVRVEAWGWKLGERGRMESTASLLYAVMLRRSCSHLLVGGERSSADRACGAGRYLDDEVMGGEVMRGEAVTGRRVADAAWCVVESDVQRTSEGLGWSAPPVLEGEVKMAVAAGWPSQSAAADAMVAEDVDSFASAGPEVVEVGGATAATAAVAAGTAAHPPCEDDSSSAPASLCGRCALPSDAHAEGAAAVTSLANSTAIVDPSPSVCLPVPRRSATQAASPTHTCVHNRLHASRSQ